MPERSRVSAFSSAACILFVAACGAPGAAEDSGSADAVAGDTNGFDADPDAQNPDDAAVDTGPPDTGWTAGEHEPFPQIPNLGGRVLAHPRLVTLSFLNDTHAADYEAYANWIVGSNWLRTVGAEYGVGEGSVVGADRWASNAPATATDTTVRNMLALALQDGSAPVPADGDLSTVIYLIYFPRGVQYSRTLNSGSVAQGCYDFLGYHNTETLNGVNVPYAVILDCGVTDGTTELASVQVTASHEIIEAATDPDLHDPAWTFAPDENSAWLVLGDETADLCKARLNYVVESRFAASRVWSNAAAARGEDPCIPAATAAGPYFNTSATPGAYQTVAAGGTVSYTLRGWSTGMVADWGLRVRVGGGLTPTWALSATTMNNGGSATLDVTVPGTAASGDYAKLVLTSGDPSGVHHEWPLAVVVQ